jgi:hypothetical protein
LDHLPGVADLLQVATGVVTAAQSEGAPGRCLVESIAPGGELGTDGRADEIGAVGVEAFLDQQIDLPEVHQSQVDSDLLGLLALTRAIRTPSLYHLLTIHMDGNFRDSGDSTGQRQFP